MRSELEAQRTLGQQSRQLQAQLREREGEKAQLKSQADNARSQLSAAQTEIKALQTKLAAARNTAASLESAVKPPGSVIKGGPANRANAAANAEAAQVAQIAQLKEELYSDLTGLIIRDVKIRETDHLYDCIQTGVNGSELPPTMSPYSSLLTPIQHFISNWLFPKCRLLNTNRPNSNTYPSWTPTVIEIW